MHCVTYMQKKKTSNTVKGSIVIVDDRLIYHFGSAWKSKCRDTEYHISYEVSLPIPKLTSHIVDVSNSNYATATMIQHQMHPAIASNGLIVCLKCDTFIKIKI